jgi:hypothetical protein
LAQLVVGGVALRPAGSRKRKASKRTKQSEKYIHDFRQATPRQRIMRPTVLFVAAFWFFLFQ